MLWTIKGKIVFIPVEIKNREWTAKVLLANYFLARGYSVFLGMLWNMDAYTKQAQGCCYVAKGLYKSCGPFFRDFRKRGNSIIAWDEEGLIYDCDEHYVPQQLDRETMQQCRTVVAWGERQKKTIENFLQGGVSVLALGNPRLDLLDRTLAGKIYAGESAYIQKKYGSGYILVNSNFVLVLRKDYDYIGSINSLNGETETSTSTAQAYMRFQTALFPLFLAAVRRLSAEFPDKKIIIRPHPQEPAEEWQQLVASCPNVFVEKQFSVNPWLLHAACVLHSGCTTGMEAVIMGKPALSYQPPLAMPYPETVPDSISLIARDEDALLSLVRRCMQLSGGGDGEPAADDALMEKKRLIDYFVSRDSARCCSERIADAIDSYALSGSCTFRASLSSRIRRVLFLRHQKDFNMEFTHVTPAECRRDVFRMKKALGLDYRCKFLFLEDNEFLLLHEDSGRSRKIERVEKLLDKAKRILKN